MKAFALLMSETQLSARTAVSKRIQYTFLFPCFNLWIDLMQKSSKAARKIKSNMNHTKGALVIVDFSWIENRDLKLLLSILSYSGVNNMSSPHIVCLQIETAFMQSSFSFSCINCKRLFYVLARQLYFSLQLILLFNQQKIKGAGNEKKLCPKNACIAYFFVVNSRPKMQEIIVKT